MGVRVGLVLFLSSVIMWGYDYFIGVFKMLVCFFKGRLGVFLFVFWGGVGVVVRVEDVEWGRGFGIFFLVRCFFEFLVVIVVFEFRVVFF